MVLQARFAKGSKQNACCFLFVQKYSKLSEFIAFSAVVVSTSKSRRQRAKNFVVEFQLALSQVRKGFDFFCMQIFSLVSLTSVNRYF